MFAHCGVSVLPVAICFYRLQKERQIDDDGAGEEKRKLPSDDHEKIKETIIKATPEGTPVDNMRVRFAIIG